MLLKIKMSFVDQKYSIIFLMLKVMRLVKYFVQNYHGFWDVFYRLSKILKSYLCKHILTMTFMRNKENQSNRRKKPQKSHYILQWLQLWLNAK